ncbi:LysR family transcriptional regulator [Streptomyces sp. NBC_00669]|uniref:LysR family transcriptional regulator n=1 Tax=Streptomyces sp. NBC_00669 TaxID=2976011 RepID=UPI002E34DB66|nr:LysR family transcriptional regulator [Streptomyces sp. NBC_00669]
MPSWAASTVQLFHRTTRQVTLTPAGEVLLGDARTALDAVSAAGRRARHAGEPTQKLRLALKADVDGGLLPAILHAYAREEAALPVALVLGRYGEQVQAVRDGRADAAVLLGPFDERGLDSEQLVTEPYLIAVAADAPPAARTSVRLADLAGWELPDGSPADQGPVAAHGGLGEARTRPSGPDRDPDQGQDRDQPSAAAQDSSDLPQTFKLIELGSIVCFFPASLTRRYPAPRSPTGRSSTMRRPPCPWSGRSAPAARPSPRSSGRPPRWRRPPDRSRAPRGPPPDRAPLPR